MITVLIATASALIGQPIPGPTQDRCTIVRYAADGRRTESLGDPADFGVDIQTSRRSSSVSVRSSGSVSSSVSASASSHGSARSVSSTSHRDGDRTITTHTDNSGCTTIVDERPAARRDR